MRLRFALLGLALFPLVPAASAASSATPGVGAHGYDFLIGTWSCKNSIPSAMGGPAGTTVVIAHATNGALSVHVTGANFDAAGYVVYAAKTQTWWNPFTSGNGGYGTESTQQTGKKSTWTGPLVDPASGKTVQQRDTYTWVNPTTYDDVFQVNSGGTWKTEGNTTCTKQ